MIKLKKLLSVVLVVALVFSVMPMGLFNLTASAATEGYFTYYISNGKAEIDDVSTSISGDVVIPSTLGGYPVTSIGWYAFEGCTGLTSIEIPDKVTSIGDRAFEGCTGLISVSIPDSVTSIGWCSFEDCDSLANIYISDIAAWCNINFEHYSSPLNYAEYLYLNGELVTDVVIPQGVTVIPEYAFSCASLKSVSIPDSVTSIGNYVFKGCTELTSVSIPNSVASMGYGVFYDCTGLTNIEIPNSITSIGDYAFEGCTGLTNVSIPNSVNSIGWSAFNGCTALTSIEIPDSVTSINNLTFYGCTALTKIEIPNSVTSIGWKVFYGCTGLTSISIGNSVTSMGDSAFEGCIGLKSVSIGNGVTSIGDDAFYGCSGLTSISIGNSVTSIGKYAFRGCDSLTSIEIPRSVTSIGDWAFNDCDNLNTITITKHTTNINVYSFSGCDIETVYFKGTREEWNSMAYAEVEEFAKANIICNCEGEHTYTDENDNSCNNCDYVKLDISKIFPDTSNNAWYSNAVRYAVEAGIMTGYDNGYFGTADGIQRQDFLVMLARFDGADLNEYSGGSKFGDVATGSYFEAAVNWGYQNGIVNGYENGNFGVGDMINREQIVTFLYRYAKYKGLNTDVSEQSAQTIKAKYPDFANVSGYASDAVLWAIDRGVISGKNGNQIAPFVGAQRCEVAQIMYNINKNSIF